MNQYPRIVYMGTPEISSYILEGLINNGYNIVGVIAQVDKPVGRKGLIQKVPTKIVAEKYNIPVYQPIKIRNDYQFLNEINPDLIITCAYGQIVPQGLLDIPNLGSINVHGSLLPKYRGASPIQQALINNDSITGVTIMEMIDKMDAGKMYYKKEIVIDEDENYTSLYDKMKKAGLEALLEMLPDYIEGKIEGIEQDEESVTFCSKITKEQEHLSLEVTCDQFIGLVKGLSYTPGAYLLLDEQIFKILKAKKANDLVTGKIGEIVQADKFGLLLQLKDGQVSLLEVQKQGKSKMDYKSFVNGNKQILTKVLK